MPARDATAPSGSGTLEDVERAHIVATLAQTNWVIEGPRGAARILDDAPEHASQPNEEARASNEAPRNIVAP